MESLKMHVVQMLRSWLEQNYESIKVDEGDIVLSKPRSQSISIRWKETHSDRHLRQRDIAQIQSLGSLS